MDDHNDYAVNCKALEKISCLYTWWSERSRSQVIKIEICDRYTGVFRLVDKTFMGMREMNLELEQAEAPDRVVFKLYTAPGKSEG